MKFNQLKEKLLQIDWKKRGKRSLVITRILVLLIIESAAIVLITQKYQMDGTDAALIWAIQHKRIFVVTTCVIATFGILLDAIIGRFWIANTLLVLVGIIFAFANQQKML